MKHENLSRYSSIFVYVTSFHYSSRNIVQVPCLIILNTMYSLNVFVVVVLTVLTSSNKSLRKPLSSSFSISPLLSYLKRFDYDYEHDITTQSLPCRTNWRPFQYHQLSSVEFPAGWKKLNQPKQKFLITLNICRVRKFSFTGNNLWMENSRFIK